MNLLRPLLILLIPLVHGIILWQLFLMPASVVYLILTLFILTDVMLFSFTPRDMVPTWRFGITWPPLALVVFIAGTFLFLDTSFLLTREIVIGVNALVQGIFLLHLYYYYYRPDRYQERSLQRVTESMNTLIVFCASAVLFALVFFLDVPIWYMVIPYVWVIGCCSLQTVWIHGLSAKAHYPIVIAPAILMLELVYALLWLPSIYFVNACIIAIFYSGVMSLSIASIKKELKRRDVVVTGLISLLMLVLVVVTTKWR